MAGAHGKNPTGPSVAVTRAANGARLEIAAPLQGAGQRGLVGELDVAPHRNPARDAGDPRLAVGRVLERLGLAGHCAKGRKWPPESETRARPKRRWDGSYSTYLPSASRALAARSCAASTRVYDA